MTKEEAAIKLQECKFDMNNDEMIALFMERDQYFYTSIKPILDNWKPYKKWELIRNLYQWLSFKRPLPESMIESVYFKLERWFLCSPYIELSKAERVAFQSMTVFWLPFYPQYPIGKYFVDFADPNRKIIIEIDGKMWHTDEEKDLLRQEEIEEDGWKFIRVPASNVFVEYHKCFERHYGCKFNDYMDNVENEWEEKDCQYNPNYTCPQWLDMKTAEVAEKLMFYSFEWLLEYLKSYLFSPFPAPVDFFRIDELMKLRKRQIDKDIKVEFDDIPF